MILFNTNFNDFTIQAKVFLVAVPESLALLAFGITLVVLTVGLRWMFDRKEQVSKKVKVKR
jgi:hypothetical protein